MAWNGSFAVASITELQTIQDFCQRPTQVGLLCRGDRYIDGSLTDFINSNNSHLVHCDGEALILDYFQVHSCRLH